MRLAVKIRALREKRKARLRQLLAKSEDPETPLTDEENDEADRLVEILAPDGNIDSLDA